MHDRLKRFLVPRLFLLGGLGWSATVLGFPGSVFWLLDLFSHFRFQLACGLAVIAVMLAAMTKWKSGALMLLGCGVNLMVMRPLFWPPVSTSGEAEIRLLLANVNTSLGDPDKLVALVTAEQPDVVVLQELGPRWREGLETLSSAFPHQEVILRTDNFGIGVLSRTPFHSAEVLKVTSDGVPSLRVRMEVKGKPFTLLTTHPLPPVSANYTALRNRQLRMLPEWIDPKVPTVVAGDLNITPWHPLYRQLEKETHLKNAAEGFGYLPTWPTHVPILGIPIDHVLASETFQIVDVRRGADIGSDHLPLIVDLRFTDGQTPVH